MGSTISRILCQDERKYPRNIHHFGEKDERMEAKEREEGAQEERMHFGLEYFMYMYMFPMFLFFL